MTEPTVEVLGADDHDMTQDMISNNALKVLNRLIDGGFDAYLVGGGGRDALGGQQPKDFDVATEASPEEVKELFRNSRIIGRRFRLVHVLFGRDVIEVATFRAAHDKGDGGEVGDAGQIVRDNVFGTVEEDAMRRDFSVNALYYNIANDSITDYCGGLNDMRDGVFRLIGDPVTRCEEDPVRVLRAARLSAKLDFEIHEDTLAAMQQTRHALAEVPAPRLFEEMLKLFQGGYAERSFNSIREHGLLPYLFPMLAPRLDEDTVGLEDLLTTALQNTDARVAAGKPITPYYLLSFMLWPDVEQRARMHVADGMAVAEAIGAAADSVTAEQVRIIAIPRRFSEPMREVWALQLLLEHAKDDDVAELMQSRRFRAAYDFLLLRASIDDRLQPLADWWTEIQSAKNDRREELLNEKPELEGFWGESPEQLENLVVPTESLVNNEGLAKAGIKVRTVTKTTTAVANVHHQTTVTTTTPVTEAAQIDVRKTKIAMPGTRTGTMTIAVIVPYLRKRKIPTTPTTTFSRNTTPIVMRVSCSDPMRQGVNAVVDVDHKVTDNKTSNVVASVPVAMATAKVIANKAKATVTAKLGAPKNAPPDAVRTTLTRQPETVRLARSRTPEVRKRAPRRAVVRA